MTNHSILDWLQNAGKSFLNAWKSHPVLLVTRYALLLSTSAIFIIGSLIWAFQERILFYPEQPFGHRDPNKNPIEFRNPKNYNQIMAYEDCIIVTSDRVKLHAWLIKAKTNYETAPTVIYFHGNAGNIGFRLPHVFQLYSKANVNVMMVSYRGYGLSEGSPTEIGLYKDAEAAYEYFMQRKDLNHKKLLLFGRSLGGAVAIDLAARGHKQIQGMIVENTFTNLFDMAYLVLPFCRYYAFLLKFVQRLKMDSISKVEQIKMPILFVSGEQDKLVPAKQMDRLFKMSLSQFKWMLKIPNGAHDDTWLQGGNKYWLSLVEFISCITHMPNQPQSVQFNKFVKSLNASDFHIIQGPFEKNDKPENGEKVCSAPRIVSKQTNLLAEVD